MSKVIISCAITGSIHTPTMSPYLPITPEQIATSAIGAAEAGAAILHLHARSPDDGSPSSDPAVFRLFLPQIKDSTDAIINITTGGAATMTIDQRIAGPLALQPEMCSLNMGSMNFGLYPALNKFSEWQHDWEVPYLSGSRDRIFRNTFTDIETILERLGKGCGTRFEYECYDVGHLYNLKFCMDIGLFKAPIFIQFIFGILGGIGPEVDNLVFMKRTADRLFGDDYRWSVLGAGGAQMTLATTASQMGGHVRVGLEDSLFISRGKLADNNAHQVAKIRRIVEDLGCEVATPDEARDILALKGGDRVNF